MSFSKDIQKFTDQYRRRMNFVARDATARVFRDAQRNTAKGGRMRIDTGFLRASAVAKVGSMPSGPTTNESGRTFGENAGIASVEAALLRWAPAEDALFIGWTANYARWREYEDGFLRGATERWQEFVRRAVNEAKRKNL